MQACEVDFCSHIPSPCALIEAYCRSVGLRVDVCMGLSVYICVYPAACPGLRGKLSPLL